MDKYMFNQQTKYFCFLMIRTTTASIIGYIYLALNIIFFIMICRQMFTLWKIGLLTKVSLSFYLLCLWSMFSIIQIGFYQYMYKYLKNNKETQTTQINQTKSLYSFISFLMTFFQIFLIHTVIIRTPYNWHSNIITFMQNQSSIFDDQQQKIETRTNLYLSLDRNIKKILNWFLNFRYFALPLWVILSIVLIFILQNQNFRNSYALILYAVVTGDAFLILIIYMIGYIAIWRNNKLKSIMETKQLKKIHNKYYLVIFSTIIRVAIFIIRNPLTGIKDQDSFLKDNCQNQPISEFPYILFLILQAIAMDFLPALIIYFIYRAPKQEKQSFIKSGIQEESRVQFS